MKLMCVNNLSNEIDYNPPITTGKIYESIDKWDDDCKILNDAGFYRKIKRQMITLYH